MNEPPIEAKMPLTAGLLCLLQICLPMVLMLLFSLVPAASWGSVAGKANKGNREYHRENFEQALKHYRDAQLEDPESPPLHFNIGNALYKQQNWEEAMAEYRMTLASQDSALAQRAFYNMGNTLYRQGNLTEAIEAYKKALRIDSEDLDAKYNLELALKKLQETPQQQPQQSEEQQQEQDQEEPQDQQEQQQQQQQEETQGEQDKKQQEKAEQEEERQQSTPEREEQEQSPPQPREPGEMSPEEAARLLNALAEQDKRAQEERQRARKAAAGTPEWDW